MKMDNIIRSYAELPGEKKAFLLHENASRLFVGNKVYGIAPAHIGVYRKDNVKIIPQFIQYTGGKTSYYYEDKPYHDLETATILYSIPTVGKAMYGLFYVTDGEVFDVMFADKALYDAIQVLITERREHLENPSGDLGLLFEQMRLENIETLSDLYLTGEKIN